MNTIFRIAAATATTLALMGTAHAQTPARVPGQDGAPETMSTHRPGAGQPMDTVEEVTSSTKRATPTNASGTSGYVDTADGPMERTGASSAYIPTRTEVAQEAAAMNRADTITRGELSVPARAGAPEGGFQRRF